MGVELASLRTGYKDLLLPIAVVAVVGMMIFPLPSVVLDVLLMCNIAFALALLISAVYLSEPERFTALPSILLFATLFRLGLNISTTRQLLSTAEAPDVVATFGNFVVNGNLIVGAVIFIIVTIVQFLVISKGAERVAEVAARFTLDAMPGRQMSIDADVRAGMTSLMEARDKRRALQRESKLYGALDGAMKFVKGDSIAGLLITVINISAGLLLGVTQQGLSFADAAQKYTLFTIGDGLVSQIPALLVAVAAGIAVTRVEGEEGSFIGRDLFSQLSREPQALATTATVMFMLSLIPGLPTFSFLGMAGVFALGAYRGKKSQVQREHERREGEFRPKVFSAVVLRISPSGTLLLQEERKLPKYIQELRNRIFEQWGVIVPDIQFDIDYSLQEVSTWVYLHGVRIHQVLGDETNYSEKLVQELGEFLKDHLAELIDDTQTRMLLEVHQPVAEDLINHIVPEILPVTALTTILRHLVWEGVSIKEVHTILQAVAEFHLRENSGSIAPASLSSGQQNLLPQLKALSHSGDNASTKIRELLTEVRIALSRTISRMASDEKWQMHALVLSPQVDHLLSETMFAGVPLDPNMGMELIAEISEKKDVGENACQVIITSKYARIGLSKLLRMEMSQMFVLAVEEVSPEVGLHIHGEVGLQREPLALEQGEPGEEMLVQ